MRKMYKYHLPVMGAGESFVVDLPFGAVIRHVGSQTGGWMMWVEVDWTSRTAVVTRTFRVFATGEEIPDLNWARWEWRGTWQDGPFVWHLFEKET